MSTTELMFPLFALMLLIMKVTNCYVFQSKMKPHTRIRRQCGIICTHTTASISTLLCLRLIIHYLQLLGFGYCFSLIGQTTLLDFKIEGGASKTNPLFLWKQDKKFSRTVQLVRFKSEPGNL